MDRSVDEQSIDVAVGSSEQFSIHSQPAPFVTAQNQKPSPNGSGACLASQPLLAQGTSHGKSSDFLLNKDRSVDGRFWPRLAGAGGSSYGRSSTRGRGVPKEEAVSTYTYGSRSRHGDGGI